MTNCEDAWKRIERRLEKEFGLPYKHLGGGAVYHEKVHKQAKKHGVKWAVTHHDFLRTTIIHSRYSVIMSILEELGISDIPIKVHLTKHNAPVFYAHADNIMFTYA